MDALGGINLFLKLQGDSHNYQLSHDTEALKASLKNTLQEQGRALKALWQGSYQDKARVKELAPDDYFDFD